ncbi:MAG: hypothetical protein KDC75_00480 [Phaeodactylibacter sp.]|nr:hypothetical protein [Phaeodactylibacter sp.]
MELVTIATTMRGTVEKSKLQNWREKAKQRRLKCEYWKRRSQGLEESRDNWKDKAKARLEEIRKLEQQLKCLGKGGELKDKPKPRGHSYSLGVMQLALMLRQRGEISYRGCCKVLYSLQLLLCLDICQPSYSSIRYWEQKMGYHRLSTAQSEPEQEWVLIIDESIAIGREKLLLFLGVNLAAYSFGQPLSFEDVEVLGLAISRSWKAPEIQAQLEKVMEKGFNIVYGVADQGNNLRKTLAQMDIVHVADCTHAFSLILEKEYKKHEVFQRFCQLCGQMRRKGSLSKYTAILPPAQRSKARYLNLTPLFGWASDCLKLLGKAKQLDKGQKQLLEHVQWLKEYEAFIIQTSAVLKLFNQIQKTIKYEGLNDENLVECKAAIKESTIAEHFKESLRQYLQQNRQLLPGRQKIICCSDIIESYFGKYKMQAGQNITQQCLRILNYGKVQDESEIKAAMEQVKIVDLNRWSEENLPLSTKAQRRRLFKNTG